MRLKLLPAVGGYLQTHCVGDNIRVEVTLAHGPGDDMWSRFFANVGRCVCVCKSKNMCMHIYIYIYHMCMSSIAHSHTHMHARHNNATDLNLASSVACKNASVHNFERYSP